MPAQTHKEATEGIDQIIKKGLMPCFTVDEDTEDEAMIHFLPSEKGWKYGTACNIGLLHHGEFEYDEYFSLDENITGNGGTSQPGVIVIMKLTAYTSKDIALRLKGSKYLPAQTEQEVFRLLDRDKSIKYSNFGQRVAAHKLEVSNIKVVQLRKQQKIEIELVEA